MNMIKAYHVIDLQWLGFKKFGVKIIYFNIKKFANARQVIFLVYTKSSKTRFLIRITRCVFDAPKR